jgi:hypothetical protein
MCIKSQQNRQTGSRNLDGSKNTPRYGVPIWSLWPNSRFLPSIVAEKNVTKNGHIQNVCSMCIKINSRQTGSRNLTGPKTLPTIWGTYMKLVTKYQISAINSCWEKCDEKCAYMFNVYKNQLSRQTGSRKYIYTCINKKYFATNYISCSINSSILVHINSIQQ